MTAKMRLSKRLGSIKLSSTAKAAAAAERLRRQGADVVDLGVGEPDFPTPDNAKRAAIAAIERNFTRYTAIGGIPELREPFAGGTRPISAPGTHLKSA
jgi:aspartate aminotransferase